WLDGQLSLTNDRLVFDNKRLKLAFLEAIAVALSGESASFRIDATIFRFSPIAQQLEWLPHQEETIMFTVKQQKASNSVPIFAIAYEFTEQETRLLLSLTVGCSLRDCASYLNVSYETIRWHVKNMCAKSGYGRANLMIEAARSGDLSGLA
ncbi:helix-turn-helix transcriptional regulator, partial [Parasphingorhabdus sp.]|uniref:helix-turn-helix transcriptional regulator n=1 Tax=Parasphingorhabdus sp. TaxID=2709688 RepID=UPI0035948113